MEEFFQIGKGDRIPSLKIGATTRVNGRKVPLPDLASASSCLFYMRKEGATGAPAINGAVAVIEDAVNAILRYDWGAGDTAVGGWYDAEFKLVINGKTVTVPNDDMAQDTTPGKKIKVYITEDVAS